MPTYNDLMESLFLWFVKRRVNKRFKKKKVNMLFIVGHSRSGSSLLQQILNLHPQMVGWGASQETYNSVGDYVKGAVVLLSAKRNFIGCNKYVVDRIMNTEEMPNPEGFENAKFVFLIREPYSSLSDIYKMNLFFMENPDEVYKYYSERLEQIVRFSKVIPNNNWTFLTYDEMNENPKLVSKRMDLVLALKKPLGKFYPVKVKKRAFGSSKVLKTNKENVNVPITHESLHPELQKYIEQAEKDYNYCLHMLKLHQNPVK